MLAGQPGGRGAETLFDVNGPPVTFLQFESRACMQVVVAMTSSSVVARSRGGQQPWYRKPASSEIGGLLP